MMLDIIKLTLASAIGSVGFAILFNIRGNKLIFACLGGGLSWFVYDLLFSFGLPETAAFFISSICFSIYSEIFARILKTPVTTLVICCLIPLVPGAGMYNTMYQIVTGNLAQAVNTALATISSAGVLALGIIFVSTITRLTRIPFVNKQKNKIAK